MLEAASYYSQKNPGLGTEFLDKIDSAVRDIGERPECWPIVRFEVRRRRVRRFPYALLYCEDPEEVVVLAVRHHRRHPDYWIDRV